MTTHRNSKGGTGTPQVTPAAPDEIKAPAIPGQEAVFLGWQETKLGDLFALYNIQKTSHPSNRSTVTEATLHSMHLRTPRTPSPFPSVAPSPWNKLGTELSNLATAREAIEAAGLNYTVVKKPLKEVLELDHPCPSSKFHPRPT